MVVVLRRRFYEEVTTYSVTKTWTSSNNFWRKVQYNIFEEDLPVSVFTDQLKAFLIRTP